MPAFSQRCFQFAAADAGAVIGPRRNIESPDSGAASLILVPGPSNSGKKLHGLAFTPLPSHRQVTHRIDLFVCNAIALASNPHRRAGFVE